MPIDNTNRGSEKAPRTLINIAQLSALWNIPKATLYNWVSQGPSLCKTRPPPPL